MGTGQDRAREYRAERRRENKARAIDYLGGECRHCGTSYEPSLQFVHHPYAVVSFEVSQKLDRGWDSIQLELDKCYLACRSCYRNGGVPNPNATIRRHVVTPLKRQLSPLEEREAQQLAAYLKDGETLRADQAVIWHNDMANKGKGRECSCDFCEDTRHGRELPPAYKIRLKELKNWGN